MYLNTLTVRVFSLLCLCRCVYSMSYLLNPMNTQPIHASYCQ